MSIRTKFGSAMMATILVAVVVGVFGVVQMSALKDQGVAVYARGVLPTQDLADLREIVQKARMDGLSVAVAGTPEAKANHAAALSEDERRRAGDTNWSRRSWKAGSRTVPFSSRSSSPRSSPC